MTVQQNIEAATLTSAMAAAFAEIEGATKSTAGQVGQQKYKYADLTSVIEAIKPALIKHSLFFTQHPEPSDKGVCVETVLHHAGGEHMSLGKLFVPANKNDAQGYGSALTYCRRYALVTAFGVPVEDDDGNAAVNAQKTQPKQQASDGRITDEQLVKIQMLLKATKIDEITFLRGMKAPDGARLFQLPQAKFAAAVERLEAKLADMAKAETNNAARPPEGEFNDITEADCPF